MWIGGGGGVGGLVVQAFRGNVLVPREIPPLFYMSLLFLQPQELPQTGQWVPLNSHSPKSPSPIILAVPKSTRIL